MSEWVGRKTSRNNDNGEGDIYGTMYHVKIP